MQEGLAEIAVLQELQVLNRDSSGGMEDEDALVSGGMFV